MLTQTSLFSKKQFALLVCIGIIINATGLFNEILEPDGTLYAFISKQIALNNNWADLYDKGLDWLDKPHFPFWLTAISFKLFGVSAFAYKLPSFICWLGGIYYCYKLSEKIFGVAVAQLSTLIYITVLYVIVANFDVRAEGFLTAFIIAATYHMYMAIERKWLLHILLAAVFCAAAIMTKGIFVLITIASGFIIYWIKTKQWKEFINIKWYLLAILSFVFILPELYSLYLQFDIHPEKVVFGQTHVSGLQFFFWDSQFGRFVNTGPIKGKGDIFFFFHTTLWEFMPWIILLILALVNIFKKINRKPVAEHSWIIGSSALITFLLFSLSKFQLPHYIIIIFPHLSMLTAFYMLNASSERILKRINIVQLVFYFLLCTLIISIAIIYGFDKEIWLYILIAASLLFLFLYKTSSALYSILKKNFVFALSLAVFLNCFFYPSITQYQAGMIAGKWLNANYNKQDVRMYKWYTNSLEFYCNGNVLPLNNIDSLMQTKSASDTQLIFSPIKEINDLQQNDKSISCDTLKTFYYFHVSQVTEKFLQKHTRSSVLDTFAIAIVKRKI